MHKTVFKKFNSFTLVELMIVIAVLSILAAIILFALNPAKVLNKARDSKRISDINSIYKNMSFLEANEYIQDYGSSTTVYISLPDSSSTCSSYTLPTLLTGYTYNCVTSTNLQNTDSTGWIPINFNEYQQVMSVLPIDPVNDSTYFYSYFPGGSYEVRATLTEQSSAGINDGGYSPYTYEKGTPIRKYTPMPTTDMYPVEWDGNLIMVDKYEMSADSDCKAQSKQGETPWTYGDSCGNLTLQLAKDKCAEVGKHLITMEEWGMIALWSYDNSTVPGGNNYTACNATCGNAGLDKTGDRDGETSGIQTCSAVESDYNWNCGGCTGDPRCQTGTGPVAWSHNNQEVGIYDLNGNVWEFTDMTGTYGYLTNGLWWKLDQNKDGKYDSGDIVYVIVPANGAMLNSLGEAGVENLITGDDNNDSNGGAAAWISNVSGSDPYTITIENPIGDIDQFRYGNGTTYGDGYYWFSSSPIHLDTSSNYTGTMFKCTSYDTNTLTFSGCTKTAPAGKTYYGDDRAPTIDDVIVSFPQNSYYGDASNYYHYSYIDSDLRSEDDLKYMVIPKRVEDNNYNSDRYYISPYGSKMLLRGGYWSDGSSAGLALSYLSTYPAYSYWYFGGRCSE